MKQKHDNIIGTLIIAFSLPFALFVPLADAATSAGSRILNDDGSRSPVANEDTNVIDWDQSQNFIVTIGIRSGGSERCQDSPGDNTIFFKNVTAGGAFTAMTSSTEMKFFDSANLTDGNSLSLSEAQISVSGNYENGEEEEDNNIGSFSRFEDGANSAIQFPVDPSGGTPGDEYQFRFNVDGMCDNGGGNIDSVTVTLQGDFTTVGTATAVAASSTSIDVIMPYTDDPNTNNTYTVDFKLSSAGTFTNHVTNAAHTASPFSTTITGLTPGESYDVRMTYNDADGVNGTNPQTVTNIPVGTDTTVGSATATGAGSTSIDVSMPYTDDGNANNTYSVDFKLSSAGTFTNHVTNAAHTASPFFTTITGLTPGESYDVQMTYNDADGVNGTNPQTVTNIALPANPTAVGVATAVAASETSINVSMPYTGDVNANNTYTVEYQENGGGFVIWPPNPHAHSASPFTTTITGLTPGATYDVRMTYNDADGVVGTNPQTVTSITLLLNSTTAGTTAAVATTSSTIAVTMPYTNDGNANNTYTVDFKLSSSGTYTNHVTNAAHTASPFTTTITGLTPGETYDVRMIYNDADGVVGTNPQTILGLTLPTSALTNTPGDDGSGGLDNIAGLMRIDGGNDVDNRVGGKPKVDVVYEFTIIYSDPGGVPAVLPTLFIAHRTSPVEPDDFFKYNMNCIGDWTTGATCTYRIRLGPAASNLFYFSAVKNDGVTPVRIPDTANTYITGPLVELMFEQSIMGAPRDINASNLTGLEALGHNSTFRWNTTGLDFSCGGGTEFCGAYEQVVTSPAAKTGEGYFAFRSGTTLPTLDSYSDITAATFDYSLGSIAGWKMIANPYNGDILLSDVQVRQNSGSFVSWNTAVSNGWLTNAIYYYNGEDFGGTYSFETTATPAVLTPWLGFWIHVNDSNTYTLRFTKPAQ